MIFQIAGIFHETSLFAQVMLDKCGNKDSFDISWTQIKGSFARLLACALHMYISSCVKKSLYTAVRSGRRGEC